MACMPGLVGAQTCGMYSCLHQGKPTQEFVTGALPAWALHLLPTQSTTPRPSYPTRANIKHAPA